MTQQKSFRLIAVVSYLLVMLMGQMIAILFFLWLLSTVFNIGSGDQIFALLAVAGIVTIYVNRDKTRTLKILALDFLCFLLLASPLVKRMNAVPIELFNYWAFIIPTALFVLAYAASLFLGFRQYSQVKAG